MLCGAGPLEDRPDGNRLTSWARLLRAGDADDLLRCLVEGLWAFPEASDEGFREALHAWAQALCARVMPGAVKLPARSVLERRREALEMTTLIEANFNKWKAGLVQQGIAQGMEQGRTEGIAQSRTEGVAQGAEQERERLRELARQLDPETAAKVAELLDQGD